MGRSFFWDRIAKRYSKQPVGDEATYQKKLEVTREYFQPEMEVFEFGCGTGSTAIAHAPFVKHIQAIDISSNMIEIAKGKATTGNIENVTFSQSSVDEFNASDQTFDAVMGHSILHLLDNKEQAIAKVHKMLKPGGVFITSTACIGKPGILFKILSPIGKLLGLILRAFTEQELEDAMTGAGFVIDYKRQPSGKSKSLFMVAKKVE